MNIEWISSVLPAVCGALFGAGGGILYFRPKLKEAKVSADKTQVDFLESRIESVNKLYEAQGQMLDELRQRILDMGKEMQLKDERIIKLEAENKQLTQKIARMEKELSAYKTISKSK